MNKLFVAITFVLTVVSVSWSAQQSVQQKNYHNNLLGYTISYPSDFTLTEDRDTLQVFASDFGAIVTSGENNQNNDPDYHIRNLSKDFDTVTYSAKGSNWVVVSGYSENKTVYAKRFFGTGSSNTLLILIPQAITKLYSKTTTQIAKSFIPGALASSFKELPPASDEPEEEYAVAAMDPQDEDSAWAVVDTFGTGEMLQKFCNSFIKNDTTAIMNNYIDPCYVSEQFYDFYNGKNQLSFITGLIRKNEYGKKKIVKVEIYSVDDRTRVYQNSCSNEEYNSIDISFMIYFTDGSNAVRTCELIRYFDTSTWYIRGALG